MASVPTINQSNGGSTMPNYHYNLSQVRVFNSGKSAFKRSKIDGKTEAYHNKRFIKLTRKANERTR